MDTPTLVAELDRALPGFSVYLKSEDNLFDSETPHGVFAACSHFVEERQVASEYWAPLAEFINKVVVASDEVMSEAACTCSLENLANARHPLKRFLSGKALRNWQHWEGLG